MLKQNMTYAAQYPLRFLAGSTEYNSRTSWGRSSLQNSWTGGFDNKSGYPSGYRAPASWAMAPKSGALSAFKTVTITSDTTGSAVRGLPATGSAAITITSDATGGLIVSGVGSATISLDATGTVLSVASASGTTTVTLTPTALIGAQAGLSATGNITITPTALIRAVGFMSGISTNEAEFSPEALGRAVWSSALEGTLTAEEMMRIILAVQAGKTDISGSTVTFRDLADSKARVTAVMTGSERTTVTLDGE